MFNLSFIWSDIVVFRWLRLGCWLIGCKPEEIYGGFDAPENFYMFKCEKCGALECSFETELTTKHKLFKGFLKKL